MSNRSVPQKIFVSRSLAFGKGKKNTPPPPICTIPLPAAKPGATGPPEPATPNPEFRKFAVSAVVPSRRRCKNAGYPLRSSGGMGRLVSVLLIAVFALIALVLVVWLPTL